MRKGVPVLSAWAPGWWFSQLKTAYKILYILARSEKTPLGLALLLTSPKRRSMAFPEKALTPKPEVAVWPVVGIWLHMDGSLI